MGTLEARIRWLDGTFSVAQAGKHAVAIDRPESAGGRDGGFKGGELLLVSLGGCLTSTLAGAAQSRNITLTRMNSYVTSTEETNPARIVQLDVEVDLAAVDSEGVELDESELDKLLTVAERGCLVTNTLKLGMTVNVRRVGTKVGA